MTQKTVTDRVRAVQRTDRGDMPPESLITMAVVMAAGAAVIWFFGGDRLFYVKWWLAIPMAVLAVLSVGVYVSIKAPVVIDGARRRRAHGTGE